MKKMMIMLSVLATSLSALAADQVQAVDNSTYPRFDQILGYHRANSATSQLGVNVIELLAGDGMNSTRIVLTVETYQDGQMPSKTYEIPGMLEEVTRATFLAKDVIVINYKQDTCNDSDCAATHSENKSMKITVQRTDKGDLTDRILVEDLK